jgi:hypothetical protein
MSSKMEAIKAAVDRLDTSECRGIVVNKVALAELRALVAVTVGDGQGHAVAEVVDYVVQTPHQHLWYGPELGRLPVGTRLYLNPAEQPDVVALQEELQRYKLGYERLSGTIEKLTNVALLNKSEGELLQQGLATTEQRNAGQTELLNALIRRMGIDGVSAITGCSYTHPKADLEEMLRSGFLMRELADEFGISIKPTESVVDA